MQKSDNTESMTSTWPLLMEDWMMMSSMTSHDPDRSRSWPQYL